MASSSGSSISGFDRWVQDHNGLPTSAQQIELVKHLFKDIDSPSYVNDVAASSFRLVSWNGVTASWFLNVFMKIREVQVLRSFGCRMWFVRNVCITAILRRRGVTSNGSVIDHIDQLKLETEDEKTHEGDKICEEASVFISYTGQISLDEFCSLISHSTLAGKHLWMDLICVCQFSWTERKDEDMKTFKKGFMYQLREKIGHIGSTALLMNRWDDLMLTLGKIWVLWEIYSTANAKASLDVLLTDSEAEQYFQKVFSTEEGMTKLDASVAKVDVRNATSYVPEDQILILGLMEDDGVFNVNSTVLSCMRNWFVAKANQFCNDLEEKGEDNEQYVGTLIQLHMRYGQLEDVLRMSEHRMNRMNSLFGPNEDVALMSSVKHALSLVFDGTPSSLSRAESLLLDVLQKCEEKFDGDNDITISAYTALKSVLTMQRRPERAETYIRKAISGQTLLHGQEHPLTIKLNEDLLQIQSDESHIPVYEETLLKQRKENEKRLGTKHHETVSTITDLACYYETENRLSDAARLYSELLRTNIEQLGLEHTETILAIKALAAVHLKNEDYTEAEKRFSEALSIEQRVLGPGHRTSLTTMSYLIETLDDSGRHVEAERLSQELLRIAEDKLGKQDSDTLAYEQNHAHMLFSVDKDAEAVSLFRVSLDKHRSIYGEEDERTVRVLANLGFIVAQRGSYEEGIEMVQRAATLAGDCQSSDSIGLYVNDMVLALKEDKNVTEGGL